MARGNLGYGKKEKRFPKKESLHYVYSRHLNTERPIETGVESVDATYDAAGRVLTMSLDNVAVTHR